MRSGCDWRNGWQSRSQTSASTRLSLASQLHDANLVRRTDADAEVVAEYIVALLKTHTSVDEAYQRCLSEVPEFFREGLGA
ncbi:MAG: hypothetical protein INR71_02490 [Terriglobus roseus]|nr:hypothetical protein [Terriglobus roseus]